MSFQVTVLKVLAGHPDGRLSVDDLKRSMVILISSGPEWSSVSRSLSGTNRGGREAGRALLAAIENAAPVTAAEQAPEPMYSTFGTSASTRRRQTSQFASPSGQLKKTRRLVANLN